MQRSIAFVLLIMIKSLPWTIYDEKKAFYRIEPLTC